jgi:lactoylglutathione lyase
MIRKLEHVGIFVSDMDRSLAFYQDVLGLALRERIHLTDEVELAFLYHPEQPDVEVELVCGRNLEAQEGRVNHLAFTVDRIEEEIERLKERGVEMADQVPRVILNGVKIAFFFGPDGEKLELVQR